eukprot:2449558-Pleurochrysis_carterae.AAC.4
MGAHHVKCAVCIIVATNRMQGRGAVRLCLSASWQVVAPRMFRFVLLCSGAFETLSRRFALIVSSNIVGKLIIRLQVLFADDHVGALLSAAPPTDRMRCESRSEGAAVRDSRCLARDHGSDGARHGANGASASDDWAKGIMLYDEILVCHIFLTDDAAYVRIDDDRCDAPSAANESRDGRQRGDRPTKSKNDE